MPNFVLVVGFPGVGKSTWIDTYKNNLTKDAFIASTDDVLESIAKSKGLTYNDVFKDHIDEATSEVEEMIAEALAAGQDIIIDQTNLSPKSRRRKLSKVPKDYRKTCVVFEPPEVEEWQRRLDSRPGKTIPNYVIESMADAFVFPTKDEGFDVIIEISR